MRERSILFSGPMVRALLDGRKSQTRRAVKLNDAGRVQLATKQWHIDDSNVKHACPYGQPGDRLWVRETWMPDAPRDGTWADTQFFGCGMSPLSDIPELYRKPEHCLYRATWNGVEMVGWEPSIHMPRWASRITLEITDVRVERLQDISEVDAVAEGIQISSQARRSDACYGIYECLMPDGKTHFNYSAYELYRILWEQINGPGSWGNNPWVWVVHFKRVK